MLPWWSSHQKLQYQVQFVNAALETFMLATFLLSCAHLLFYKFLPVLQTGDVQKHLVIIQQKGTSWGFVNVI